jgi:hypothetical protein
MQSIWATVPASQGRSSRCALDQGDRCRPAWRSPSRTIALWKVPERGLREIKLKPGGIYRERVFTRHRVA